MAGVWEIRIPDHSSGHEPFTRPNFCQVVVEGIKPALFTLRLVGES